MLLPGEMHKLKYVSVEGAYSKVELKFAPFQSWFIVFRKPDVKKKRVAAKIAPLNSLSLIPVQELTGAWSVHFDTEWGGPASVEFNTLEDWTKRPEENIKYYSGKARYVKQFDFRAWIALNPISLKRVW